jgi:uncharacterized protein (TIRG00374 family)
LQFLLGLAISAVCIWLLLRQVDLNHVGAVLSQARPALLVAAAAMYFVAMSLRAWRWTVLLTPIKRLSLPEIWPVTAVGYAGNVLLPARMGEVLRIAVLRKRGVSMSAGLATVAAERMIDGLATVAVVLITMRFLPQTAPQWLTTAGQLTGAIFAAGLVLLWVMLSARPWVERVLQRMSGRLPLLVKPAAWALRFVDGLGVLRSPGLLARTLAITALAWLASIAEYWLAMRAVDVNLSAAGAAFSLSAIGLSSAVPAAPGYVGTQELVGVTVLGLWGVPAATALAASLAFHVIDIVPIAIVGLIVGWRDLVGPGSQAPGSQVLHPQAPSPAASGEAERGKPV